jgi:hypothetical protein
MIVTRVAGAGIMMTSRPVRTASVCGIALAITVTVSACGRASSSESSAPPPKAADHQS